MAENQIVALEPADVIECGLANDSSRTISGSVAIAQLSAADNTAIATAPDLVERRYALRLVEQRLHQASFRDSVLAAYDHRCAISNLPDDHLLDAARIMADAHELLGQPIAGTSIRPPRSEQHHPDRDRFAIRFEQFKRAA